MDPVTLAVAKKYTDANVSGLVGIPLSQKGAASGVAALDADVALAYPLRATQAAEASEPVKVFSYSDTPVAGAGPLVMGLNASGTDEYWRLWHRGIIVVDEDGNNTVNLYRDATNAYAEVTVDADTKYGLDVKVFGDTAPRVRVNANATLAFSSGSAGADVTFGRLGANVVGTSTGQDISAGRNLIASTATGNRIGTSVGLANTALSIVGSSYTVVGSDSATDAANKTMRFCGVHYTNAEEPAAGIQITSTSGATTLSLGGGSSLANAATTLNFYTAANNTTVTGTIRMAINSAGLVTMNAGANIASGTLAMGGVQALTTRRTGWGVPTGTATRTTFATSTVTLSELAERVKALIDDLNNASGGHGLIGA